MRIRRPVAVFLTSVALVGAAGLTGCANERFMRTGTPADQAQLTTGGDPSSDSQGNLPQLSNREAGSSQTRAGVGAGNQNSNSG